MVGPRTSPNMGTRNVERQTIEVIPTPQPPRRLRVVN
jgi:hypothetical protein